MILVTGCAGLLGNNFSRYLLEKGYCVVGIDNFFGSYQEYLPQHDNFYFLEGDLTKMDLKKSLEKYHITTVFHFAAYAAEGLSPFIRKFNYTNNVIASVSVINFCIEKSCKLIFSSSMAVMGEQPVPFTEDQVPAPIDPYGIAKYTVEMDIKQAHEQFGMEYTVVRPHNIIGIYQNIWDKYRNVAGIFIRRVLQGEPVLIYGDGEQTRAFSNVYYYMEPLERLIKNQNNDIFHLGADRFYSINYLSEIVMDIALKYGYHATVQNVEGRYEVKHAYCDHTKAKKVLDFKDNTDLEDLIDEMFFWALNQKDKTVKFMNCEIEKGLYSFWK